MKARNPSTGNLEEVYVKALDSLPVGIILEFPTTNSAELPIGYMFCDGSAISRTTYSTLFALIGTSYGVGDGSTTFNLPNYKGRVPVGLDSSQTEFDILGETGGSKYLQEHTHNGGSLDSGSTPQLVWDGSRGSQNAAVATSAAGTGDSGNLQPYIVTNYIIKVAETRALAGKVVNAKSNSTTDAYSCDYVNGTVLWTNSDLTADFSAQNIQVDFTGYSKYEIIYYSSKGDTLVYTTGRLPLNLGSGTRLFMPFNGSGNSFITSRTVNIISTGLNFADAYYHKFNDNSEGTANNRLIPLKVIGYK